jgi:hypothetical protein
LDLDPYPIPAGRELGNFTFNHFKHTARTSDLRRTNCQNVIDIQKTERKSEPYEVIWGYALKRDSLLLGMTLLSR